MVHLIGGLEESLCVVFRICDDGAYATQGMGGISYDWNVSGVTWDPVFVCISPRIDLSNFLFLSLLTQGNLGRRGGIPTSRKRCKDVCISGRAEASRASNSSCLISRLDEAGLLRFFRLDLHHRTTPYE